MEKKELEHHRQYELCKTRLVYRQGRKLTAIKAYSICNESVYLLIYGVPKLNLSNELKNMFQKYGKVQSISLCVEYVVEDFTECFKIKFEKIQSSRIAKKMIDTKNFYGGSLHVCYAPEFETIEELRSKMKQRQLDVLKRMKYNRQEKQGSLKMKEICSTVEGVCNQVPNINVERQCNFEPTEDLLSRMVTVNCDNSYDNSNINPIYYSLPSGSFQQNSFSNLHFLPIEHFDDHRQTNLNDNENVATPSFSYSDKLEEFSNKSINNINSSCKKREQTDVYVFKPKRRKKHKESINKKEEDGTKDFGDEVLVGPQCDFADLPKLNSNGGRVVVCEGGIDRSRIFSAPKRKCDKITLNLKKSHN